MGHLEKSAVYIFEKKNCICMYLLFFLYSFYYHLIYSVNTFALFSLCSFSEKNAIIYFACRRKITLFKNILKLKIWYTNVN